MGEVFRARDEKLDRDVAVKVLPARLASEPEALARFEREAKSVAALSHPNIEQGVNGVFVQDFVPGQDTSASRKKLAGFDPAVDAESLGCRRTVAASPSPGAR